MFVVLKLSWLEHPFAFNRFIIQTEAQVETLRKLGLQSVDVDPERSRVSVAVPRVASPDVAQAAPAAPAATAAPAAPAALPEPAYPAERHDNGHRLRADLATASREAARAAHAMREATRDFITQPAAAAAATDGLMTEITQSLLNCGEVMVHLLAERVTGEEVYVHGLNVAVLGMLLGKAMQMGAVQLQQVGMAGVLHDLGKQEIPSRILLKGDALNHAEQELLRQHPRLGAELTQRGQLPEAVVTAILQHHEHVDGSGYPQGLEAEQISTLAKVVAVVNCYDNLCNPPQRGQALTPYEALSTMYAKRSGWFDAAILGRLVHVIGVYPPGSLVQLSNGATAMVVAVNAARPLQPNVMLYDAAVPPGEAPILDLEKQPSLSILRALRPSALSSAERDYLNPRERVAYYFGEAAAKPST